MELTSEVLVGGLLSDTWHGHGPTKTCSTREKSLPLSWRSTWPEGGADAGNMDVVFKLGLT